MNAARKRVKSSAGRLARLCFRLCPIQPNRPAASRRRGPSTNQTPNYSGRKTDNRRAAHAHQVLYCRCQVAQCDCRSRLAVIRWDGVHGARSGAAADPKDTLCASVKAPLHRGRLFCSGVRLDGLAIGARHVSFVTDGRTAMSHGVFWGSASARAIG
jgi:hypothetical protein